MSIFVFAHWTSLCSAQGGAADEGPVAIVSFPYEDALVRANVPVFGLAYGGTFESYKLEFGQGNDPQEWTRFQESTSPQSSDPFAEKKVKWNKDWGTETGNLGTWQTGLTEYPYGQRWEHNLLGPYTLRLTVTDKHGHEAQHSVHVIVGRVVRNDIGGAVESPDGISRLEVGKDSITTAFVLVSLLPSSEPKPPKGIIPIGTAYEFQPPGLEFITPALLRFKFSTHEVDAAGAVPDKLIICSYDPVGEEWEPLPTKVDPAKNEATSQVSRVQKYLSYYGLFADVQPPEAPVLAQLPSSVQKKNLPLTGKAEPRAAAVITLNGKDMETLADSEGRFSAPLTLDLGENVLSARCRDSVGNTSEATDEHHIELHYSEPKAIREIRILGGAGAIKRDDRCLVHALGGDASPDADVMLVRLFSAKTDPNGFLMELSETGEATGEYVGEFTAGAGTDPEKRIIAAKIDGEAIIAARPKDETKRAECSYVDRIPPSSPEIKCETSLYWSSFCEPQGRDIAGWRSGAGDYGASITAESEKENGFLRMQSKWRKGILSAIAGNPGFRAGEFPMLSFGFRANAAAAVDLLLTISGKGCKGIRLTDDQPFFPQIGSFGGMRADNQWHQCDVNLLSLLKTQFPSETDWKIERIEFADWDGGDRIFGTKFFGQSASRGGCYDIDNFGIMRPSTDGKATFTWSAHDDSGIEGYSYVLDREPSTIPPEEVIGTETKKAYEELADGRWWFHVRAKDKCGNWGPPNHAMVIVDTKPPEVALEQGPNVRAGFEAPVLGMAFDEGAGIDPATIRLEADGRLIPTDAITADPKTCALELHPNRMKPWPQWYVNDFPIELRLAALKDFAGRPLPEEKRWRLIADSPITVPPELVKRNGWCKADPKVLLSLAEAGIAGGTPALLSGIAGGTPAPPYGKWHLAWMRSLAGDHYAEAGRYIREIGLFAGPAAGAGEIPIWSGSAPPRFVAEIKVDTSVPRTEAKVQTVAADGENKAKTIVTLSHSEFAWRRGGLLGRYYRARDFSDLICERVDPFIYFFDDRGQFTPPVAGAHSATWDGAVYISKAEEVELELAIWNRGQASGSLIIDGKLVLELLPKDMGSIGYKKQTFKFTEGMHEISLRYGERKDSWTFALFRWRDGQGWKERIREPFGDAATLYYPQNVGTTFFRWNDQPEKVYTAPLVAPTGENVLTFWTVDQAGNEEQKQRRTIRNEE